VLGTLVQVTSRDLRVSPENFDEEAAVAIFEEKAFKTVVERERAQTEQSPRKRMKCTGRIEYGHLDTAIGDCTVLTGSREAGKIFAVCNPGRPGDHCTIDAIVEG